MFEDVNVRKNKYLFIVKFIYLRRCLLFSKKLFEKRPPKNDLIKDVFATGSVMYKLRRHHKTLDLESANKKASKWFIRNHLTITILKPYNHRFSLSALLRLARSSYIKVQMKCFFLFPNLKEQQKSGRSPFTVS